MVQEMYRLFHPQRKQRPIVAVDETKEKREDQQMYILNAIDIKDHVALQCMSLSVEHLMMRYMCSYVSYTPTRAHRSILLMEDLGIGGLFSDWSCNGNNQECGERNHIGQRYNQYKAPVKRFWKRFPYHRLLQSINRWSIAWTGLCNLLLEVS